MKNIILISVLSLLLATQSSTAQPRYFTREGKAHFHSKAPLEDIQAVNKKVTSILDVSNGDLEFSVLIKAFEFEKALMQEHFNENYMESDKFPKATFKGQITNSTDIKWDADGTYAAHVTGKMTIHGVTNDFSCDGKLSIQGGKITASTEFKIKLAEYNIKIPSVVKDKISEMVDVDVEMNYEPYTAAK